VNVDVDWPRVKALFAQAMDLPEAERDAWIGSRCTEHPATLAELRSLLAVRATSKSDFLSEGAVRLAPIISEHFSEDAGIEPGSRIGAYRLLREIGVGGMGRVFLAERADGQFTRQVALKLIRSEFSSPDLQRRFMRERDTLARLAHPNIATLHDGGLSDDGAPWFTMEFVDGEPITHWCDEHRSDIRSRVELVLKVCDAVQDAHRNLVVHRDIKPSNILVTQAGEPKLLDFGIAKPISENADDFTGTQMQPMTREYAAPEQVTGEPITTATDVYALGVLLYLLLSGHMPYRRAAQGQIGWIKAILEDAPESMDRALDRTTVRATSDTAVADDGPERVDRIAEARSSSMATLKRALRGDLDRIAQRALAKAPESRYPTVSAMADDLRAYLGGRALSGGTRTYRLRKFVRRHWLPMGATALLLAAIIGGAALATVDAHKIEREARRTAAVKTFLLDLLRNANPTVTQGKTVSLRDVVDRGVARLDSIPLEQFALKAELQNMLGMIYYHIGLRKEASELHAQAFDLTKDDPDARVLAVTSERFEGVDLSSMSDNARAQELVDDAVQRAHALGPGNQLELARTLDSAVWVAAKRRDNARVAKYSEESRTLADRFPDDEEIAFLALSQEASAARSAHDHAAAAALLTRAVAAALKSFGPDAQETQNTQYQLGNEFLSLGRFEDAQGPLQAALDSGRRVFGSDHARTLRAEQVLAINEIARGHVAEGSGHFAHQLDVAEKAQPRDDSVLAEIRLNYAGSLIDLGRLEDAQSLLVKVVDFLHGRDGGDTAELEEALSDLGRVQLLEGQPESAEAEAREGISLMAKAHSDEDSSAWALLSEVLVRRQDFEGAVAAGLQARDHAIKSEGDHSYETAWARTCYGEALAATGQTAAAEVELRTAVKAYADLIPSGTVHPASTDARLALGHLVAARSDGREEGLHLMQQAVAAREQFFGSDNPRTREARDLLARSQ
jgi:serine/threonine protein kinase/tetratricopeptide (TPR) repeat protein